MLPSPVVTGWPRVTHWTGAEPGESQGRGGRLQADVGIEKHVQPLFGNQAASQGQFPGDLQIAIGVIFDKGPDFIVVAADG